MYALQAGETGGNYDLGVLIEHSRRTIRESRENNPQRKSLFPLEISTAFNGTFLPVFLTDFWGESRPNGVYP
jgi:hypothetical protein